MFNNETRSVFLYFLVTSIKQLRLLRLELSVVPTQLREDEAEPPAAAEPGKPLIMCFPSPAALRFSAFGCTKREHKDGQTQSEPLEAARCAAADWFPRPRRRHGPQCKQPVKEALVQRLIYFRIRLLTGGFYFRRPPSCFVFFFLPLDPSGSDVKGGLLLFPFLIFFF